jgi:hypothetical protein
MASCLNSIAEPKYDVMKKMFLIMAVLVFTAVQHTQAQIRVNVNINLGSQPAWGPAGYDYVEYYYLPDLDIYYYVPGGQFIYLSGGQWLFVTSLPARYRSYNLYNSYKVVINEPKPYLRHGVYQSRYAKYKGWSGKQSNNEGNSRYKSYKGGGSKSDKGGGKNNSKGKGHGRH